MSMLLITLVYFVRNQYLKQSPSCIEICGACPPYVMYDFMLDFLDMDFLLLLVLKLEWEDKI